MPWSVSHLRLLSPARPIALAPAFRANCTAIEPTPPAAPETTTVSPGLRPTRRTAAQAVVSITKRVPACSPDEQTQVIYCP
jgi:hypothetical protein